MAYTALYRKWRPLRFEDVRGQDPIVKTLRNQVETGRVGHAYLFCGTRGTGKTTAAKILARAVNCEHPVNGSPCNECPTCRAILAGSSMNVVEIDAASNNGVDNVRQIRDEVQYSPTEGHYRVYIIDEVHMLSAGAFNALLKTLEEPPAYVIFILATTEVQKIPITILSRCQRYDFRRIGNDTIFSQLKHLTEEEGVAADDRALRYVAKAADGSMRDSLSLLEQCIAFYYGSRLTYENVLEVLGAVDAEVFSRLIRLIAVSDISGMVGLLDEISTQGRDLVQFVTDFVWYMRNLLLLQTGAAKEDALEMSADNLRAMREEARMIDVDSLLRYIRIFSELSGQIKYTSTKRILLEITLIRLMKPAMDEDVESLQARIGQLEDQVSALIAGGAVTARPIGEVPAARPSEEVRTVQVELEAAQFEDLQALRNAWPEIESKISPLISHVIRRSTADYDPERGFVINCELPIDEQILLAEPERMEEVNRAASEMLEKKITLSVHHRPAGAAVPVYVEKGGFIEGIAMEIGVEE